MSVKEQIQYEAGINYNFLTEGIQFFKNSKRIEKLIKKFEDAMNFVKDNETKQEVNNYIRELQKAKLDFEGVEAKFSAGNKEEAKEEYKQLKVKFAGIMTDINKESLKKFMIVAGLVGFAFATFATIVPSHSPVQAPAQPATSVGIPLRSDLTANEKAIQQQIKINNDMLRDTRDKLRAFDLFQKNQELLKKLAQEQAGLEQKLGK